MPNSIVTNKLTDLVALRFLVNAPFLTVGAKEHFKDQMQGKRAGQEYTFVIRDAAPVYDGEELKALEADTTNYGTLVAGSSNTDGAAIVDGTNLKNTIQEREIKMKLRDFAQFQDTNLIEPVTDMNWDKEVATPNGGAMAQKVVKAAVTGALSNASVAIVGGGFSALAEVAAHMTSISGEKIYGFIDPKIQAILTTNGQQFQPVGSPSSFYKSGLLGTFHEVEYRSQRFLPVISAPSAQFNAGTTVKNADGSFTVDTSKHLIKLTLTVNAADDGVVLKKGTPLNVEGVFATDLIGTETTEKFAFIVAEDVTLATGDTVVYVGGYVDSVDKVLGTKTAITSGGKTIGWETKGLGARLMAKEDGDVLTAADFKSKKVTFPLTAGKKYFIGQVRLDGSYEFCTLDKLDSNNAESKLGAVATDNASVKVHENRVVNNNTLTNRTRWDVVAMFGTIEQRGVANIYVEAN
jgi:hypothetical protein